MSTASATEPDEADVWETGIREIFETISELRVFWRDQKRPSVSPREHGFVTLFVTEDRVVGIPETRTTFNAAAVAGAECEPSLVELHALTLVVGVETYSNAALGRGRWYVDRIRRRLRRDSTCLALGKISTSLIDVGPILSGAVPIDGRQRSLSTILVRLHTAICERDKALGYIDVIRVTPTITQDGGVVIPGTPTDIDLPDP